MAYKNFKFETDADGIALVIWDIPGRSMNVRSVSSAMCCSRVVRLEHRWFFYSYACSDRSRKTRRTRAFALGQARCKAPTRSATSDSFGLYPGK